MSVLLAALPLRSAAQTTPFPLLRPVRDSAFAVHQLFKKHRHSAEEALGTGVASIVGMISSSARGEYGLVGIKALVSLISTVVGLRQALRYSSLSLCASTSRADHCYRKSVGTCATSIFER